MTTPERLGAGDPDGQILGYQSTDKIGFYGAVPVVQASTGTLATTAPTSSGYGFTSTQAQTLLNIGLALKSDGLVG